MIDNIQAQYKAITLQIANHLGIKIHHDINQVDFDKLIASTGKSSAPKTFIQNGELYLHHESTWSLAIQ